MRYSTPVIGIIMLRKLTVYRLDTFIIKTYQAINSNQKYTAISYFQSDRNKTDNKTIKIKLINRLLKDLKFIFKSRRYVL